MASRSICKLFAEHNYQIQSPSLKVHAHRVYGEKVRVNPAQIFEVIEPSNDLAFEVHSNYGVVLVLKKKNSSKKKVKKICTHIIPIFLYI